MAALMNLKVLPSLLVSISLFSVALLQAQGATINRRQTNRIECTSSGPQCQFYSHCIDSQFPCSHDGFILSYLEERCRRIDGLGRRIPGQDCSSPNSCVERNGYKWAHATEDCMKTALKNDIDRFNQLGLRNDPSVCLQWERNAIDKMNACYSKAWEKYNVSEADAASLSRLFRIGDYYDTVVDKGIPSLLRRHYSSSLATELATNKTYDRRLYCVTGEVKPSGSSSLDLTAEQSIAVVQHALRNQDLQGALYHYGGKDRQFDGEPCNRNQPTAINFNPHGFHLVTLFVPHETIVQSRTVVGETQPRDPIVASVYELSDRSDDSSVAVVNYTRCGDGIRHAGEECDYGYGAGGCSLDCRIEAGYDCSADRLQPSICSKEVCGDGLRTRGEECDDSNNVDGDGCSSSCRLEPDTHSCDTEYNVTSVCQACPCAEKSQNVQYAPKRAPAFITARRLSPPHKASNVLAASRQSSQRTVHLAADSSSVSTSPMLACFFMTAIAALLNLLWR